MKMDKILDVHADDYGYSLNTSMDMLQCMKEGRLDSVSIICNTKWFEESMEILYDAIPELPFLPLISIHINLPEGTHVSPILPMSWGRLFMASYGFSRKKIREELKKDIKWQIDKTQKAIDKCISIASDHHVECHQKGIRIDSHVHTHLIPVVWDSLIDVIEEEDYQIEYIRNPKEPIVPFVKEFSLWKTYNVVNFLKNRILMFYSGKVDRYCEKNKIDKMYMCGLMMSGHMDRSRVVKLLPDMMRSAQRNGRKMEFLFHPGQALDREFSDEMNPEYFEDFNSSENRQIENEAVMSLKKD